MKTIEAISHIKVYKENEFVERLNAIISKLESEGLEVEIQYSAFSEIYTALVIGRKVEKNGTIGSSKTIRQTL